MAYVPGPSRHPRRYSNDENDARSRISLGLGLGGHARLLRRRPAGDPAYRRNQDPAPHRCRRAVSAPNTYDSPRHAAGAYPHTDANDVTRSDPPTSRHADEDTHTHPSAGEHAGTCSYNLPNANRGPHPDTISHGDANANPQAVADPNANPASVPYTGAHHHANPAAISDAYATTNSSPYTCAA